MKVIDLRDDQIDRLVKIIDRQYEYYICPIKIIALAKHLGLTVKETIIDIIPDERNADIFIWLDCKYLVLNDDEADTYEDESIDTYIDELIDRLKNNGFGNIGWYVNWKHWAFEQMPNRCENIYSVDGKEIDVKINDDYFFIYKQS